MLVLVQFRSLERILNLSENKVFYKKYFAKGSTKNVLNDKCSVQCTLLEVPNHVIIMFQEILHVNTDPCKIYKSVRFYLKVY